MRQIYSYSLSRRILYLNLSWGNPAINQKQKTVILDYKTRRWVSFAYRLAQNRRQIQNFLFVRFLRRPIFVVLERRWWRFGFLRRGVARRIRRLTFIGSTLKWPSDVISSAICFAVFKLPFFVSLETAAVAAAAAVARVPVRFSASSQTRRRSLRPPVKIKRR